MKGRELLIGVTGGIAAYKTAALVSQLVQAGAGVTVVMTRSATRLVGAEDLRGADRPAGAAPASSAPARHPHIELAEKAESAVRRPGHGQHPGQGRLRIGRRPVEHAAAVVRRPGADGPGDEHADVGEAGRAAQRRPTPRRRRRADRPEEGYLSCGMRGPGRMAEPERIFQSLRAIGREKVISVNKE